MSKREGDVSAAECASMRLLFADGWSKGELRMTFHVGYNSIQHHLEGDCAHPAPEQTAQRHGTVTA